MATRSLIGKLNANGTITNIYCHYDGYPDHNGVILKEHYDSPIKVDQLLALGNLSVLGDEIGSKQNFDKRDPNSKWCLAYGRDRGECNQQATTDSSNVFFSNDDVDYLYLYNSEFEWECYKTGTHQIKKLAAGAAA